MIRIYYYVKKLRNQILDVFIMFAINSTSALHSSKMEWKEFILLLSSWVIDVPLYGL